MNSVMTKSAVPSVTAGSLYRWFYSRSLHSTL